MSFTLLRRPSNPAGGVATTAMSIGASGAEKNLSCGNAFSSSGIQNSAFSVSLAKRMFTAPAPLPPPPPQMTPPFPADHVGSLLRPPYIPHDPKRAILEGV